MSDRTNFCGAPTLRNCLATGAFDICKEIRGSDSDCNTDQCGGGGGGGAHRVLTSDLSRVMPCINSCDTYYSTVSQTPGQHLVTCPFACLHNS